MQPTMPPATPTTDSHQGSTPQGDPNSELQMTAPGQMRVIKRNGKLVTYTDDKIKELSFTEDKVVNCRVPGGHRRQQRRSPKA